MLPSPLPRPCVRWHPDIPAVASVTEGELFRVETIDWTGGQIKDNDDASDVKNVDLTCCHHLSGPIRVTDAAGVAAKPGDLLVVEICDLGPLPGAAEAMPLHCMWPPVLTPCSSLPGDEWGYTGTFDRNNGGGFLTDHFPCASKAIWQFDGVYASSRHIPGVRFAGIIHPGLIGTAPSQELLDMWNEREGRLCKEGEASQLASVLHTRPLALLPEPKGALLGGLPEGTAAWTKVASEAARTIPGRENGGNCDIKNLSRGCRVYLPVFVEGANLSMGDMHFSQGDGEVSFCGAIEMSGFLTLKCDIIRGGVGTYLTPMGPTPLHVHPIFEIGPLEPRYSEYLVFEGISVDETGKQHFLDATVAFKRATLDCINYLAKCGLTKEQAYLLLSACPCEGRISGIVDIPNAVATLAIPVAIFDWDIRPKTNAQLAAIGPVPPAPGQPRLVRVPRGNVCLCRHP